MSAAASTKQERSVCVLLPTKEQLDIIVGVECPLQPHHTPRVVQLSLFAQTTVNHFNRDPLADPTLRDSVFNILYCAVCYLYIVEALVVLE